MFPASRLEKASAVLLLFSWTALFIASLGLEMPLLIRIFFLLFFGSWVVWTARAIRTLYSS